MNQLIKRVEKIQRECVDAADKSKLLNADGTTDAFTLLRRKIGLDIKGVRELIKERNESEEYFGYGGSVRTVQLSHEIRKSIIDLKLECGKLQRMHDRYEQKYKAKGKINEEKEKKIELTKETCELAWAHVKELEMQNRQMRNGESCKFVIRDQNQPEIKSENTPKQLPDIDNDDFRELIKNDKVIDGVLNQISDQLKVTENLANELGKAASRQGNLLDTLNDKADVLDEKLENINVRLHKMIKGVRKADLFIIDVLLIFVLLGIIAAIVSAVKS